MDDLIYLIYVIFSLKEITLGSMLFLGGCVLVVVSVLAAFIMLLTSRSAKRKMDQRMKEKY